MKFAKELEEDLVPEWRVKYFNYKIGKKKVKAVSRALRNASKTPQFPTRPPLSSAQSSDRLPFTQYDFAKRHQRPGTSEAQQTTRPSPSYGRNLANGRPTLDRSFAARRQSVTAFALSPPTHVLGDQDEGQRYSEESSDSDDQKQSGELNLASGNGQMTDFKGRPRYGSIVGSPPTDPAAADNATEEFPPLTNLQLPDPALDPAKKPPSALRGESMPASTVSKPADVSPDIHHASPQSKASRKLSNLPRKLFQSKFHRKSDSATPHSQSNTKRGFARFDLDSPALSDIQLEAYRELDAKQDEFFSFLDKELDKIDRFYKQKEDEASSRLQALREQLHEMRDRRIGDLETAKRGGRIDDDGMFDGQVPVLSTATHNESKPNGHAQFFIRAITDMLPNQNGRIGKTSKAMQKLGSPAEPTAKTPKQKNDRGDYVRRQQSQERVPYRFAKRRLKLALQEFYRSLELLKSYALLNRTAFRKINKKYDKAVMARPPLRYMSERVNNAHFVQSSVIEGHLVAIEDLYARYFQRGNRKVAVNKLRSHLRSGEQSSVSFRNGLYVAAGTGFAISGLANGIPFLFSDDILLKTKTSYLFQLYGGYFMAVLLFLLFVLDCRLWTKAKINYTFVFEYDTRHVLDWRQLAELPCFFLLLNGLFMWLNFQFDEAHPMYLYWPIILIGVTILIIFLPFKIIYYQARKWWLYSNFRLLLAGIYPVEFRDFYLGDMYCSETYTMSQIELFFCLYANQWNDPAQCNSNHSRLLGFFTTLPAVWRALQCLRRYYDSRNWFPHLANFAKYLCNILYYMTLSFYRLHLTSERKAVFIVFAAVNAIYSSFWDVFMDFSLGNPWSKNFLLRDHLAYRRKWVYYFAMVADVTLRQQWILYAIFTEDLQHSAAMSFFVALAEVLRRGMWSLFRVENEHCNNVEKFRASRDVPLPYSLVSSAKVSADYTRRSDQSLSPTQKKPKKRVDVSSADATSGAGMSSSHDLERAPTGTSSATGTSSMRRRTIFGPSTPGLSALQRVGTVIAAAHAQDFEKRRRPELVGSDAEDEQLIANRTSDDDEEEEIDEDTESEHARLRRERTLENREAADAGSSGYTQMRRQNSESQAQRADQNALDVASQENVDDLNEVRERISRARSQGD